jgi:hypothetical protein
MTITNFNYLEKNLKNILICLLFSFNIFFWGIIFDFIQLRFLIFFLIFPILLNFNRIIFSKFLKYFLISVILFLHLFFQTNKFQYNYLHSIFGFFFILIILDNYKVFFFSNLHKIIYLFLIIFYLFIFIQYLTFDDYFKQVSSSCVGCFSILRIFFKENSHLALTAPSVIFYLLFISTYNKFINYFALIIFLSICFVNPSLTLYIGLILLSFLGLFFKIKLFSSQKIFLIFLTFFLIFKLSTDTTSKVKITDFFNKNNNINLSTEVYKTSYIVAKKALFYKPLGYGFNNYSEAFNSFVGDLTINNKEVLLLNAKDASNNFSKIVSEFGIFSIFFFYFLISFFLNKKIDNKIKIFLILPIIIQTFVRGAGYFNGGFLLFVFYAFVLWINSYLKKNQFK